MWYHGYGLFGGGAFFMMLIPLAILGVFIYMGYKLLNKNQSNTFNGVDDALRLLNERFVKGEIDEVEYLQKKAHIMKK